MIIDWIAIEGIIPYLTGLKTMETRVDEVIKQEAREAVFLLEHEECYTAGTSAAEDELLNPENVPVIHVGRGGKFTYHGPGQRVVYPVLNLTNRVQDLKWYVNSLEQWIINTLSHFEVKAFTSEGKVGIWCIKNGNPAKIAAIGIRARKWVSYYGIAININTNLNRFSGIIPCGIKDFGVTSLHDLGIHVGLDVFDQYLKKEFYKIFV